MADRERVSFGIKTTPWNVTYDEILTAWQDAEIGRAHV